MINFNVFFIIIHRHSLQFQYAPAMLIVFCIQLAGSIASYAYRYHFDETLNQNLNITLALYNGPLSGNGSEETLAARHDWDVLQAEVRCVLNSTYLHAYAFCCAVKLRRLHTQNL